MYILKTQALEVFLTEEEGQKVESILLSDAKRIKVKGNLINTNFAELYLAQPYLKQKNAKLSVHGKYQCIKCGLVFKYADRHTCKQEAYGYLKIGNKPPQTTEIQVRPKPKNLT